MRVQDGGGQSVVEGGIYDWKGLVAEAGLCEIIAHHNPLRDMLIESRETIVSQWKS